MPKLTGASSTTRNLATASRPKFHDLGAKLHDFGVVRSGHREAGPARPHLRDDRERGGRRAWLSASRAAFFSRAERPLREGLLVPDPTQPTCPRPPNVPRAV